MLKKNFTRKHLLGMINKDLGFSKNTSAAILDEIFESLKSEMKNSSKVKISSFGTFEVLNKKERLGRNPKTKEKAKITARKVVKFRPSLIVKKKINNV